MMCPGSESWRQALIECDLMSRKLHPALMPLIDHKAVSDGGEGGTVYVLMPLFQSGSLWDYVEHRHKHNRVLPASEILSILSQVRAPCLRIHLLLHLYNASAGRPDHPPGQRHSEYKTVACRIARASAHKCGL